MSSPIPKRARRAPYVERIDLRLPVASVAWLNAESDRLRVSRSEIVRRAIERAADAANRKRRREVAESAADQHPQQAEADK